jgi:ABC transporter substrate binding protein
MDHPPDSVSRYRELIAVAVSQIDGDPIVGDRLVDPALEITVAHFKKITALQRAGRRNPMTHENAEDLTANILVGRSVKHRSTMGFARHRSYGRNLAGIYAGPILTGEKPGDPPVQRSSKVEIFINVKTAKALRITIPQGLVISADEVFE